MSFTPLADPTGRTPRQRYLARLSSLRTERATFDGQWKEIAEVVQPRAARFLTTDRNKGIKLNQAIVNNTATRASRVLAAGMMSGITSPARRWARLTTPDPRLAEFGAVKEWLHIVEDGIFQALAKSNIYLALQNVYGMIGNFGTSPLFVEDDPDRVLWATVFPLGQFSLANSAKQRVDTIYRECSLTVGQMVQMFGKDACSPYVRNLHANNALDQWIEVLHIVEPNAGMKHGVSGPDGMPFRSCWIELGGTVEDRFLRESGYEEFPAMVPRWSTTGEDVYGECPGMEALGDIRALQLVEKRKAQLLDKIVAPPMRAPLSMQARGASLLPGAINYADSPQGGNFEPAIVIHPQALPAAEAMSRELEKRIDQAYFADLWLMFAQSSDPNMTAREVSERHEEKMLQLGPVMERLEDELLRPLIDRVYGLLNRRGELPPPPKELQGVDVRVEFLSIMATAQKMLGIGAVKELVGFAGSLAAVKPDVLDKIDFDQTMDEMGAMLGVPPALVRTDEAVAALRQQRAQAQQAAQQQAQAMQMVQGAQVLSQTNTQDKNGLTDLLGSLGGAAASAAGGGQTVQ